MHLLNNQALIYYFAPALLSNTCPEVSYPGEEVGRVTDPDLNEASGLVASQTHDGIFWTIEDHKGPNMIYGLAVDGTLVKKLILTGAENEDWEAIVTAPCER